MALLGGCALLSRPPSPTTLRLPDPHATLAWPDAIQPGRATAALALRSDRVVVADGALLMQHAGLRWVDAPAAMLSEYVRRVHANRRASASAGDPALDLWLTEFNLTAGAGGVDRAVVGLVAELRCPSGARHALPPGRRDVAVQRDEARAIAAGFAAATAAALTQVLQDAADRRSICLPAAPPAAS